MRRKRTKVNTIRLPEDLRAGIAAVADGTAWSFNVATARIVRLGLACLHEQNDNMAQCFHEIMTEIRAKIVRDHAEEEVRKLKAKKPPNWNKPHPKSKSNPLAPAPSTPSLSA